MVWKRELVSRVAVVQTVVLMVSLAAIAQAADPIGRISISGRLGVSGYDMGAINDGISRSNRNLAQVQPEWEVPGRIHSGFDFLGDVSYDLSHTLRLGLTYSSSSARSSVDYLQVITVEPKAVMIVPRLFYRLPYRPMIDMSLRVFAGPVFLKGVRTKISHENTSEGQPRLETMTIQGSGTGIVLGVLAEYTLSDRFTLAFEGGYRRAKAGYDSGSWSIPVVQDPGSDPDGDERNNDVDLEPTSYLWGFMNETWDEIDEVRGVLPTIREDLDADFSGALGQIGLRVYF